MWIKPAGVSVWKAAAGAVCGVRRADRAVALQAAVNAAARQLWIDAAPHRLDDVVERQGKAAAQLDNQGFFPLGQRGGQPMRAGRAIDHILTVFPARYGAAMDAELAGQHAGRGGAFLNIGADARRGGGVGVQFEVHQRALPWGRLVAPAWSRRRTLAPVGPPAPPTRRAVKLATVAAPARGSPLWTTGTSCASPGRNSGLSHSIACHNRVLSRQSSETKHAGRGTHSPGRHRRSICRQRGRLYRLPDLTRQSARLAVTAMRSAKTRCEPRSKPFPMSAATKEWRR